MPFTYWTGNLHNLLSLRAKTMLLIALSLPDDFTLPYERVPDWYGVSPDTAQRGLRELQDKGILHVRTGYKPAPLTAQGWAEERRYSVDKRFRALSTTKATRSRKTDTVVPPVKKATPTAKKAVKKAPARMPKAVKKATPTAKKTTAKRREKR